jgi:ribosomal silencing factor RsfS
MTKRYIFELKVIEKVDAEDEEEAREQLERSEEWQLIDVTDVPVLQRPAVTKNLEAELNG